MWPTPTTGDHSTRFKQGGMPLGMAARMRWPTPTADDADNVTRDSGDYQSLTRVVRNWPTPKARDYKDGKTEGNFDRNSPDLGKVVGQSATSGALNPTWVEWLMGFPLGWTDLGPSATRSSRRSSK
jgi:DNA (cytosine-5)-methyltransferase 1